MKLYMHPVSMTSRPVRLFIAENDLDVEEVVVDLMTGEHLRDPYASMNPNKLVPMLEDEGGFRLTESSSILKYLASKFDLPSYPKDLKRRAKVDEIMDWFNTQFYRDLATASPIRRSSRTTSGPATRCRRARSRGARSGPRGGSRS
jgi:glutathione S-transferase